MVAANVGSLLVTDGGEIAGVVTERDFLRSVRGRRRRRRWSLGRGDHVLGADRRHASDLGRRVHGAETNRRISMVVDNRHRADRRRREVQVEGTETSRSSSSTTTSLPADPLPRPGLDSWANVRAQRDRILLLVEVMSAPPHSMTRAARSSTGSGATRRFRSTTGEPGGKQGVERAGPRSRAGPHSSQRWGRRVARALERLIDHQERRRSPRLGARFAEVQAHRSWGRGGMDCRTIGALRGSRGAAGPARVGSRPRRKLALEFDPPWP